MSLGPFQILIIVLVVLVLFGRGRISEFMGDFGKGIKSFRKGLNENDQPAVASQRTDGTAHELSAEAAADRRPAD